MPPAALPTATVREAKAHMSEILERAAHGEATVITSRGRIVARIMPPDREIPIGMDVEAALDAAVQSGLCEAPDAPWTARTADPVTPGEGFSITDTVLGMRR
jgi:prevent-host-death family protein